MFNHNAPSFFHYNNIQIFSDLIVFSLKIVKTWAEVAQLDDHTQQGGFPTVAQCRAELLIPVTVCFV